MKRPEDWKQQSRPELLKLARALLVWNCNQAVPDREHTRHYDAEIAPVQRELDRRWALFLAGGKD